MTKAQSKCVILVDNSNIFIGGRQLAGEDSGDSEAGIDPDWRIDFGALIDVLAKGRKVARALLVGSRPPYADAVWAAAEQEGFEVIVHDRNAQGKEKGIDTELVARGTEIIVLAEEPGVLVLASGDSDLLPLVNLAREYGWQVELCAFTNSYSPQGELCQACHTVRPLDKFLQRISRREDTEDDENMRRAS